MPNVLGQIYRYAIPGAIVFSAASAALYDVKGGTRVVIFDRLRGVSDQVVNEGTHFLVPWLQKAITFDVRTKPRNISTTTGSKDLQMVSLTLRVLHRPEVGQLPKIYQVRLAPYWNIYDLLTLHRTSGKTTTNVSSPRSATKSSKPSSPNSMPPNSSHNAKPSLNVFVPISSKEPPSLTSPLKMSASHT